MDERSTHCWRTLDPAAATRIGEELPPAATVYDSRQLLVGGLRSGRAAPALEVVTEAAKRRGAKVRLLDDARRTDDNRPSVPDRSYTLDPRDEEVRSTLDRTWVTQVQLVPASDGVAPALDAWDILQEVKALDPTIGQQVSLNHLTLACNAEPGWTGVGIWGSHPLLGGVGIWGSHPLLGGAGIWGSHPSGSYASPGTGGRMPVQLSVADPYRPGTGRRPVVAVLDTGVGTHPWFEHGVRGPGAVEFDGVSVGTEDVDQAAKIDDTLDGRLTSHIGHGTFIAGLIRQRCPQAEILNVPVLDAHGTTDDATVIKTLSHLASYQVHALAHGATDRLIDVISLSLGYYHERPEDLATDQALRPVFAELSDLGIAVVAAAGNDATTRTLIPAGFATLITKPVPVTSVGALNPGAASKALFSNDGDWVSCHRTGAALVSTMPTTLQGSLHQLATTPGLAAPGRSTIDPDDFSSGFGVWSGTSFAAPLVAAEIANSLDAAGLADSSIGAARRRANSAVIDAHKASQRSTGRTR